MLFQPSRFSYRDVAEVWGLLGAALSVVRAWHAHARDPRKALLDPWHESCLLLVFCEVTLRSLLKIMNY